MEASPRPSAPDSATVSPANPAAPKPAHHGHAKASLAALTLGALGVVYGDIGTSPLYALKESLHALAHGSTKMDPAADPVAAAAAAAAALDAAVTPANVLGLLSLIVWSLILVVTVKYLVYVLRADNRGEGGIMALTALALLGPKRPRGKVAWVLLLMGLFGTALLYGDGAITPAISVLSAVEGLDVATHTFKDYIPHITIAIIVALFACQRFGTGKVGAAFGPIMAVWFSLLAVLGCMWIVREPAVLQALSPHHAFLFAWEHGFHAFVVLGSVFLVVTGGEALYADMGHFGRKPIRMAWFALVLPALLLNYFGQGALLLAARAGHLQDTTLHEVATTPFYHMAPQWALYPMVMLATVATIIASQALITGAYSITRQAIQLGYCPPLRVVQTSAKEFGQVYLPLVNWALLATVVMLVVTFKSSSALASAYGIAVALTMVITTILLYVVARRIWGWSRWKAIPLLSGILAMDCLFLGSNSLKIADGGWVPLSIGGGILALFLTWKNGRTTLHEKLRENQFPLEKFLSSVNRGGSAVAHVSGTAVFLTGNANGTPGCLLHNLKHNKVLHERLLFVTVLSEETPTISDEKRRHVEQIGDNTWRIVIRYGFMEEPNIPGELAACPEVPYREAETTYFLGRERILPNMNSSTPRRVRLGIFNWMTRNARSSSDFFQLPPNRVVELGSQVEL